MLTGIIVMEKPVGGRGKKAPYQTTHIRVPLPVKDKVEQLIKEYRESGTNQNSSDSQQIISLEDAKLLSKKLLKSKTKNIETHAKLLTAIYGLEVSASDLL
jgi:hypothetical protein